MFFISYVFVLLLQTDSTKKDDDVVEPVPQISDFVIDDLRKYVMYFITVCKIGI